MKPSLNASMLKALLITMSIVLAPTPSGYAQTIEEFSRKTKQEQRQLIDNYVIEAIKKLSSVTPQRSEEKIRTDRRYSNLIRALFSEMESGKNTKNSASEPFGIAQLRHLADSLKSDTPNASLKRFFEVYVSQMYKELYTNSNDAWKKKFDSLPDRNQLASQTATSIRAITHAQYNKALQLTAR